MSETYGEQEGTAFNGHFGCTCYHPLFCFNQFGDVEQSLLRDGNVHSAKDWRAVLEPVVARYQSRNLLRYFRADAAFANPELYEYLEAEGFEYAIRLPANDALQRDIEPLLTRPVVVPRTRRWFGMPVFCIRPRVGISLVAWWPKWSGTIANCFLVSDLS